MANNHQRSFAVNQHEYLFRNECIQILSIWPTHTQSQNSHWMANVLKTNTLDTSKLVHDFVQQTRVIILNLTRTCLIYIIYNIRLISM